MRPGIKGKLIITLIVTGVIPLIIAISITYFVSISQRREMIGESFQQLSEKARENISLRLTTSIRAIRNLSTLGMTVNYLRNASAMSKLSSEEISKWEITNIEKTWNNLDSEHHLIKGILENNLSRTFNVFRSLGYAFGEILATDDSGRLVAATNKTSDYWQADEDWWQQAYAKGVGRIHLSDATYDESADMFSISVQVPVIDNINSGKLVGIIKGVLDITQVFESVFDIDVGEGSRGILASDKGMVVLSKGMQPLKQKLLPGMLPSTSMGQSGSFVAHIHDGPDMLIGFAKIEINQPEFSFTTPWTVIVYQELDYAYAPVRKMIWIISLPGLALIISFFLLGLYIAKKEFITPLEWITDTVKRVASGDLTKRVQINSKDEMGELAESFNEMVSNLEKRTSLDNISLNMLSHLDLSDVLNLTMETLKNTFDAAFARLWIVDSGDLCDNCTHSAICLDNEKCLHLKVTVGIYAEDEQYLRIPIGGLKVGKIAETKKPSMTNNTYADKDIHNSKWFEEQGLISFVGYPLLVGDELLGVLALSSRHTISQLDFSILGSFANRTAMAIQNADLHSLIRDVNLTLEKKVEERTQELELANIKLKRADQMKSEFLANMSHELRTPLNAIIGFAEVLRDGLCGPLNEDQKASVIDIHESGTHLLRMINDILDLSKVEAGKMELQPEKFSLSESIEDVQSIIRDIVNKKQITLETKVAEDIPEINADPVKFKQIMYNLLSNAAKFTSNGGKITIKTELHDNEFLISVADTGIGIEPGDQDKIFDEFRQLDSSRSRRYEGTGLGLALTKRLVNLHGGQIWVESEGKGKGSTFYFTIPLILPSRLTHIESHESVVEKLHDAAHAQDEAKDKTILIVEDNPQAAQLLRIYMAEAGYETIIASDGELAVEMAKEIKPFAITLDIMLPKKDGWQVMQDLKTIKDTSDIPIIIVSIVDDQSFGFSMGAVGYLVKPIDKDQLMQTLNRIEFSRDSRETPPKVLVIEDKNEDLSLLSAILSNEGIDVLKALDGNTGIQKAIDYHPELIILDLLLPDISGFEVIQNLRQHPEADDIPIIICTIKELTQEDKQALNSKVQSVVYKGIDAKTNLLEAVRKIERFRVNNMAREGETLELQSYNEGDGEQ
ncbi:response regulator [Candidatus Poribacteria bacterium]|nr:response regulator [Candidatus Poribacteria bacterium]